MNRIPRPPAPEQDRNFDDLAEKFDRNIYGALKGRLRLDVLERDLEKLIAGNAKLRILDAGCGSARFSSKLVARGHSVLGCDISGEMLERAREVLSSVAPKGEVDLRLASIQSLYAAEVGRFDLVLMHGLLEWLAEPRTALEKADELLKPGGYLSVLAYNRHGLIMRSLMLGNLDKVLRGHLKGWKSSLTPTNPQDPAEILQWAENIGFQLEGHSGVRCFIDYVPQQTGHVMVEDDILEAERMLSQQEPYRSIARYVHMLFRKT